MPVSPPISNFLEKPISKQGRISAICGIAALFCGPVAIVAIMLIATYYYQGADLDIANNKVITILDVACGMLSLVLSLGSVIAGVAAYKKGERSWFFVMGFFLAVFFITFIVAALIIELFFLR